MSVDFSLCPDHLGDWAQEGRFDQGDYIHVTTEGDCETCINNAEAE